MGWNPFEGAGDWWSGLPGMGQASLALGVGGDIMGALSSYVQQQKVNELRKKLMDPGAMAGAGTAYADPIYAKTQEQVARSAAANQAARGLYQGGAGQAIMDQTLANYYGGLSGEGSKMYQNALVQALGATGAPMGSSGGTGQALQQLMMMQALRNKQPATQPGMTPTAATGQNFSSFMPNVDASQWSTAPGSTPDPFAMYSGAE